MTPRRFVVAALLAASLALLGLGDRPAPAASAELNHAAVVIDTSDGQVRKFCLAFPEESITGAEALRRIDSNAVFSSYAGQGQAVCALCGVGCPSGDCFCDKSKFWAYHRAGPGGGAYTFSRAGVSTTTVRNGDVEGWKWGDGKAPPSATVGEVCDVPEPPARTAAGATTTTSTTSPPAPPPSDPATAPAPAPGQAGSTAPPPAPTASSPAPGVPAGSGPVTTGTAAADPAATTDTTATSTTPAPPETATDVAGATDDDVHGRPQEAASSAAASRRGGADDGGPSRVVGLVAFAAVLVGILGWRAKLRRLNVRKVTAVR